MLSYQTKSGVVFTFMGPEGSALHIQTPDGQQITPADVDEVGDWAKHDPLRCYVMTDVFIAIAKSQLFPNVVPQAKSQVQEQTPEV